MIRVWPKRAVVFISGRNKQGQGSSVWHFWLLLEGLAKRRTSRVGSPCGLARKLRLQGSKGFEVVLVPFGLRPVHARTESHRSVSYVRTLPSVVSVP